MLIPYQIDIRQEKMVRWYDVLKLNKINSDYLNNMLLAKIFIIFMTLIWLTVI